MADGRRGNYSDGRFGKFDGDNGGMFVEPTKEFNPDRARVVRMNLGIKNPVMKDGIVTTPFSIREGQRADTIDSVLSSLNVELNRGKGPERER